MTEVENNPAVSVFPQNSAILLYERDSVEHRQAVAAPVLSICISEILEDLRSVVKHESMLRGDFNFQSCLDHGITPSTIATVVDEVRRGIYATLSSRNIDIDSL